MNTDQRMISMQSSAFIGGKKLAVCFSVVMNLTGIGWRWWAGMAAVGWACADLVALSAQGGVEGLGAVPIFDMRA